MKLRQRLLQNNVRPDRLQRHYHFANWAREEWINMILSDLTANHNVVVVTLSQNVGEELQRRVLMEFPEMDDEFYESEEEDENQPLVVNKVLFYSGKMDDRRKKDLSRVNTVWSHCRLLIYSPTIESGNKKFLKFG